MSLHNKMVFKGCSEIIETLILFLRKKDNPLKIKQKVSKDEFYQFFLVYDIIRSSMKS